MPPQFLWRWMAANTIALLVGYLLYTPIAHGLTGPHTRDLDASQLLAHSVALAVVALLVATAQRRELIRFVAVSWARLPLAATGFVAAFWAGFYQPWLRGPDFDILFGSFVLGTALVIGVVPMRDHPIATGAALIGFPVGCFVGQVIVLAVFVSLGIVPRLQESELQHSLYWMSVGLSMGVIGGAIGGAAIGRMLTDTTRPPAPDGGTAMSPAAHEGSGERF
jgi:hypothetical protein